LIIPILTGEEYRVRSSPSCNFLQPRIFLPFGTEIYSSAPHFQISRVRVHVLGPTGIWDVLIFAPLSFWGNINLVSVSSLLFAYERNKCTGRRPAPTGYETAEHSNLHNAIDYRRLSHTEWPLTISCPECHLRVVLT
jgi:hypothetical protein